MFCSKLLKIENKSSIVGLRGHHEIAFFHNEKPVSIVWSASLGSTEFYFKLAKTKISLIDSKKLRNFTDGNPIKNDDIISIIKPVLNLLENGIYQIQYIDCDSDYEIIDKSHDSEHFWPKDEVCLFTRNNDSLDRLRIEKYKKIINAGRKPVAITLGRDVDEDEIYYDDFENNTLGSLINFVLDGHHKLKAYKELEIAPRVLSIILFSDINQTKNKNFDYSEILNSKQLNHLNEIQQKFPNSRMK